VPTSRSRARALAYTTHGNYVMVILNNNNYNNNNNNVDVTRAECTSNSYNILYRYCNNIFSICLPRLYAVPVCHNMYL